MHDRVHESLATLVAFMGTPDDAAVASVARGEIPHLVGAIEELLEEHRPGRGTRCTVCRPKRWFRRGRRCLPCRAYLAVQLHLVRAAPHRRHNTPSAA